MLIFRYAVWIVTGSLILLRCSVVSGQDYPNKSIRIVTSGAAGTTDFAARIIAQGVTGGVGQQVIVDNRPIRVVPEVVAKAPPDGYTLLLTSGSLWLLPFLQDNVSYDPVKDFSPISLTNRAPNVLVIHPSLPVRTVKELIALAKARPGALNYATGPQGSSPHLAGELFKAMARVAILAVPYKGIAPALSDLMGGQVQLMFSSSASWAPHVKSGRLVALAVTSGQPSMLAPGLPTVAASGLADYRSESIYGIWAPAATPTTILRRLNQEIVRVLNRSDVKEKFFNGGVDTVGSSSEEFAATIKSEMERMGKVIKDVGIRAE